MLETVDLDIGYHERRMIGARLNQVVYGVNFAVHPGRTLALVGESGSGKSSIGRAILGLTPPMGGTVKLSGTALAKSVRRRSLQQRGAVQVVFQDSTASIDPTRSIGFTIDEVLRRHSRLDAAGRRSRLVGLLEAVGLGEDDARARPLELSGGQRQRVSLARALATEPEVLVLDEATSALDVSTRNQVINLLQDVQRRTGVAYVLITHDISVAQHLADDIAVLLHGRIVEQGPAADLLAQPRHPYTRMLVDAVLEPHDPPIDAPSGTIRTPGAPALGDDAGRQLPQVENTDACPFVARCPEVIDACRSRPELRDVATATASVAVACHSVAASNGPAPTLTPST